MDFMRLLPFLGQFNQQESSRQATAEARQWQEDMYNKYNSPAALVRQYNEAGINPALMFGSPPNPAPTDTQAADVPQSPTGTLTDMVATQLQLEMAEYDKEIKKMQVKDLESQISRREYQNALDDAQTNKVIKDTAWIDRLNEARTSADYASAALDYAEAAISQEEKRLGHRFGSSEALAIVSAITSALGIKPTDDGIIDGIADKVADFLSDDTDPMSIPEAIGGPVVHKVVQKIRSKKKKN